MRTILDAAHIIFVDSGLPTKYWLETIYITVYLWNLILSHCCSDIILAEIWFGKQ